MTTQTKTEKILTPEIRKQADALLKKYETKRASILEVLHLVQEKHGFISLEAEAAVADYLELPAIDVREVVSFYTLYYTKPKAKTRLLVCRTLACDLLGARDMVKHLEEKLGIKSGEMTKDGKFSIAEVECLGACELAPMMQLNDDEFIGCLNKNKLDDIIDGKHKS